MSDQERQKTLPTHRVSFARINGCDETGKDVLGPAREVGSIWSRAGKQGEGILRFDHTPREAGVYFVREVEAPTTARTETVALSQGEEAQRSETDRDR